MVLSHPSRVRGLKSQLKAKGIKHVIVAPFTGAWIEMMNTAILS